MADENAVLGDCQIGSGSNTLFEIRIWADISLEVQNPWRPLYLVPVDIKPCRTGIANLPSGVITTSVDHVCRLSVL
ncbi:hypothetical protein COT52_02875 [candidate division WWE3 bacterium CG08_land_8_20_14_0_20_43_13]|uniref:Uncharacterized protein n=1 Tax=candidate division WWE3 bacterium CG08_land_8_20_14_0_20_43_13 TaxID=1975087 RepID=A0A2H0X928_UNCKA|nr:MAG: hypothetical protein COT52_02875 [candidate division WWE3 bacterium CG08_land_8_20_14_0_20_43_13]